MGSPVSDVVLQRSSLFQRLSCLPVLIHHLNPKCFICNSSRRKRKDIPSPFQRHDDCFFLDASIKYAFPARTKNSRHSNLQSVSYERVIAAFCAICSVWVPLLPRICFYVLKGRWSRSVSSPPERFPYKIFRYRSVRCLCCPA